MANNNDLEESVIDEIASIVSNEIPPYMGLTGAALTAQIKKGIIKYREKVNMKTCLCGNEATINGAWCETCYPSTH